MCKWCLQLSTYLIDAMARQQEELGSSAGVSLVPLTLLKTPFTHLQFKIKDDYRISGNRPRILRFFQWWTSSMLFWGEIQKILSFFFLLGALPSLMHSVPILVGPILTPVLRPGDAHPAIWRWWWHPPLGRTSACLLGRWGSWKPKWVTALKIFGVLAHPIPGLWVKNVTQAS